MSCSIQFACKSKNIRKHRPNYSVSIPEELHRRYHVYSRTQRKFSSRVTVCIISNELWINTSFGSVRITIVYPLDSLVSVLAQRLEHRPAVRLHEHLADVVPPGDTRGEVQVGAGDVMLRVEAQRVGGHRPHHVRLPDVHGHVALAARQVRRAWEGFAAVQVARKLLQSTRGERHQPRLRPPQSRHDAAPQAEAAQRCEAGHALPGHEHGPLEFATKVLELHQPGSVRRMPGRGSWVRGAVETVEVGIEQLEDAKVLAGQACGALAQALRAVHLFPGARGQS
mmetsp:Transcript_40117/g.76683  ORF Transcript_40117/g.76683 Transcript_40117/m.76683 type:complete len:282 (-) Transcript_40117:833-1678(-)